MKILITGATGFVGKNLINELVNSDHEIIGVARNIQDFDKISSKKIRLISFDLNSNTDLLFNKIGVPDVLIHLAWSGLPNYQEDFHINENLPNNISFLKNAINRGIKQIIVTGTCFEYGMQEGCLTEELNTQPVTKYGHAKNLLKNELIKMHKNKNFLLHWVRLFYMYGEGQNPKSLIPSLDRAIINKLSSFDISDGDLVRDFLSINEVARFLSFLIGNKSINGIVNCCSGEPISLYQFIRKFCDEKNAKIKINFGRYPLLDYEPNKFWGSTDKMLSSSFKFKNKFL